MITQKQQQELNRICRGEKPRHGNCIGHMARRGFIVKSGGEWKATEDGKLLNQLLNKQEV